MKRGNKSGLTAKKVHTKTGMRTYWVKAGAAAKRVGGAVMKHKGKIAAAAALTALGLHLANKHRGALQGARYGAKTSWKLSGASNKAAALAGANKMHMGVLTRLRHAAHDTKAGARLGHALDTARHAAEAAAPKVGAFSRLRGALSRKK